jgi:malate synthase
MNAVKADKEREAGDGHDGTWVAHPGLVPVAMEVFDNYIKDKNQLDKQRDDVEITAADLLKVPEGSITEDGVRNNVNVSIQYTAAWLDGNGCVPINNLMEDAATAEISRAQLWQWAYHAEGKLDTGEIIDLPMVERIIEEELEVIKNDVGDATFTALKFTEAAELIRDLVAEDEFVPFLTEPAYDRLD